MSYIKVYSIDDEKGSISSFPMPEKYIRDIISQPMAEVGMIIPGQKVTTKKGREGMIVGPGFLPSYIDVEFENGEIDSYDYLDLEYVTPPLPEEVKCVCGSSACGSDRHSSWCPLYKKE